MSELVAYKAEAGIARIVMDDGKLNVMSSAMLQAIDSCFDRAERDNAVVILASGRQGIFSAGFDLKVFARNDLAGSVDMVKRGAELALRVLTFKTPVIVACSGHAFPMGAFLTLAADIRIGVEGPFKIGLNEVAIGIPVPSFGLELARQRLVPSYLNRTAITGEMFDPVEAKSAGFFDKVVGSDQLHQTADEVAQALTKIDLVCHAVTKNRLRKSAAELIRSAIDMEINLESYQKRAATTSPARVKLPGSN